MFTDGRSVSKADVFSLSTRLGKYTLVYFAQDHIFLGPVGIWNIQLAMTFFKVLVLGNTLANCVCVICK